MKLYGSKTVAKVIFDLKYKHAFIAEVQFRYNFLYNEDLKIEIKEHTKH